MNDLKVVRYWGLAGGQRHAIEVPPPPYGKDIHKYHYIIPVDSKGLAVHRVLKDEYTPVALRKLPGYRSQPREHVEDCDYPIAKAIPRFINAGQQFGITQQAQAYLEGKAMAKAKAKKSKGKATASPSKIIPRKSETKVVAKKANGKKHETKRGSKNREIVFNIANAMQKKADFSRGMVIKEAHKQGVPKSSAWHAFNAWASK